jgi:hypothetical protein
VDPPFGTDHPNPFGLSSLHCSSGTPAIHSAPTSSADSTFRAPMDFIDRLTHEFSAAFFLMQRHVENINRVHSAVNRVVNL